jgi:UPF0042 nucleotide-binding protein
MSTTPSPGTTSNRPRAQVVVVTGLSGAGKSTALHALEDLGYYCVDNLPTNLAPDVVTMCEQAGIHRVALGIDARLGDFLAASDEVLTALGAEGARDVQVVFLDASDESIVRRFSETRRPHPLSPDGGVIEGITLERERLAPLRARSTRVIDTTRYSVHELRRALVAHFSPQVPGAPGRMVTRLVSFGFKYGAPVDADVLFDVRFLANPFFVPEMKHRPGTDTDVASFVLETDEARTFLERALGLLSFTVPLHEREGKAFLTIGIGCTGGRHRSVAVTEALGRALAERGIEHLVVSHRDIQRGDVHGSRASDPGPISVVEPPGAAPLLVDRMQTIPPNAPAAWRRTRG